MIVMQPPFVPETVIVGFLGMLLFLLIQFGHISRQRKLLAGVVLAVFIASVAVFADSGIIRTCDETPWWTMEYFWYCYLA